MTVHRTMNPLIMSFVGILLYLTFSSIAQGDQYDLITNVNISQAGTVLPDCSNGCWYDSGTEVSAIATSSKGYVFDSWSGDCSGSVPYAFVNMTAPQSCTANFVSCADQPARIGATGFSSLEEAYSVAGDNNTIEVLATNLLEGLVLDRTVAVALKGGYSCGFRENPSMSLIQGQVVITGESVTVENLIIASAPILPPFTSLGNNEHHYFDILGSAGGTTRVLYFRIMANTPRDPSGTTPVVAFLDNTDQTTGGDADLLVKYAGQNCELGPPTLDDWRAAKAQPTPYWSSSLHRWNPQPLPNLYYKFGATASEYVMAYGNPNPYGCFYLMVINNSSGSVSLVLVPAW